MKLIVSILVVVVLASIVITSGVAQNRGAKNWPSFRGANASGVSDGQNLPEGWDGEKGTNIKWRVRVPGLAHSSPVVWGDLVFVTTAVSSRAEATFKPGLYGDGDASDDRSPQKWKLFWRQTSYEATIRRLARNCGGSAAAPRSPPLRRCSMAS